jgi:signal transduction histidine kinase
MRKVLALLIFFSISFGFSQNEFNVEECSQKHFLLNYVEDELLIEAVQLLTKKNYSDAYVKVKQFQENSGQKTNPFSLLLEADILYKTKSYSKALEMYKQILESHGNDLNIRFYSLINIGNIYWTHLKKYEEATLFYKKAQSILKENSCQEKKLLVYLGLGNVYLYSKNFVESEVSYNKALKIYQDKNDAKNIGVVYSNLANLFYEQYQDNKAESYFLKAYEALKNTSYIKDQQQVLFNLYAVNEGLGKYKEALDYLSRSNILKDSIWNRDKVWELAEKDKEISIAKKDNELLIQREITEAQTRRLQWSAGILILVLLFLGTLFYSYKNKVKQNKIITAQKGELEKLNHTKNYLFSVISHDLRSPVKRLVKQQQNVLKKIQNKDVAVLEESAGSALTIAEGLNHLLNNVLHWSLEQNDQMLFEKKVQLLAPVIQQVLFDFNLLLKEKKIALKTFLEDGVFAEIDRESLKVILRNLIDNAIKYTPEHGIISMTTSTTDDWCQIQVEDSGVGISKEQLEQINTLQELSVEKINRSKGVGLGLLLCTTLTKKNGGTFLVQAELNKGTKVVLSFPRVTNA